MNVLFIASVGIVVRDPAPNRLLFRDVLGLPLQRYEGDEYFFSERIEGSKHFGLWPLSQAAQACFGKTEWPPGRPIPQLSIEFEMKDVESVQSAADELTKAGHVLLHGVKTEPWGQTIARMQTPEGVIVGVCYSPQLHGNASS
jgi:catechol 2,3-dioxygenase-like lactoylglutathione lyase family enzyme